MEGRRQHDDAAEPDANERPLGRGLEDLSHLFMSAKARAPRTPDAPPDPPPSPGEETAVGADLLLRPHPRIPRTRLAAILREFCTALEQGLQVLDQSVPCPPFGEIDMLALDRDERVVIVDFETTPDDALLVRGLSHADWLARNHALVQRMYAGRPLNLSGVPRVFLLAPAFSAGFRRAAQRVPQVACTKYLAVDVRGALGVLFEGATEL
jgi:hypothetical protein